MSSKDNPEYDVPGASTPFDNCLATGGRCGGDRLCCPGTICKGGICSADTTCVGTGSHCSSSADCCGLATCRAGVCDMGGCTPIGGHCVGSADCCGSGLCQEVSPGEKVCR